MKKLRQLSMVLVLTFTLGASASAGIIGTVPGPPPPPPDQQSSSILVAVVVALVQIAVP